MSRKKEGGEPYGIGYLLRTFGKKYRISIREQGTGESSATEAGADAAAARGKDADKNSGKNRAEESNGNRDTEKDTGAGPEIWYMYVSNRRIVLTILGAVIVMFAAVAAIVIYTPVLDRLPGNPGLRSREMLTEEIERLDSLENELNYLMEYSRNVALIMEGKVPEITAAGSASGSQEARQAAVRSLQDSLLRRQIEGSGRYGLNTQTAAADASGAHMTFFASPVEASITSDFDPAAGMYGVGYTIAEPQQVVAVRDGTVIMAMWTPLDDYIIQVQHKDNAISIYKRNSQALKGVGDYVEEGEVIGYAGGGAGSVGGGREFVFELWLDGRPVDPKSFISYY